jgi:hypothetical protein
MPLDEQEGTDQFLQLFSSARDRNVQIIRTPDSEQVSENSLQFAKHSLASRTHPIITQQHNAQAPTKFA